MKKYQYILFLILLSLIGNVVFVLPSINYSHIPSQWEASSGYGRYHIINEGHISPENHKFLTWQSSLTNYATVDILPKILSAMISIVVGKTDLLEGERFHHIFPWVGTLFLPLIALYFYKYISKKSDTYNEIDGIIIFIFSIFPLASELPSMSLGTTAANSVARCLFLLILILFIVIFDQQKRNPSFVILLIMLLIPFFYFHHTWSYYLIIFLLVLFFINYIRNEKYTLSLFLFGFILYLVAMAYYDHNLLEENARIIKSAPNLLSNIHSVSNTTNVNPQLLGYQRFHSISSCFSFLNCLSILLIFALYFWTYIRSISREISKSYEKTLFSYFLAYFFIIPFLFIWNGLLGVISRMFEPLVYLIILFSAYLLSKYKQPFKDVFRIVLILSSFFAIMGYLCAPPEQAIQLTNEEFLGIEFAGLHIPTNNYIYSDFRIAPTLMYFGQQGIKTVDSSHQDANITEQIMNRCYYNVSNPEYILDRVINSKNYYFISSLHQTEVFILDSTLRGFKSASINFQSLWSDQQAFNKIYSSEYCELYLRT